MKNIQKHLKKSNLFKICAYSSNDEEVLAILAAESYFKPLYYLIFEFLVWKVLNIFSSKLSGEISLGRAQIKSKNLSGEIGLLRLLSYEEAYKDCKQYLIKVGAYHLPLKSKIAIYVGEVRKYYLFVALTSRKYINRNRLLD